MGMNKFSIILFACFATMASVGCQKVSPEIFLLGGNFNSESPDASNDPKAGRITMGSSDVQTSVGGYKLKGRVNFVATGTNTSSGGYKLTGTVKF